VYRCSGAVSSPVADASDSNDRYYPSCSTNGAGIADASIRTMYGFRSLPASAATSKRLLVTPNNMAARNIV
jgi:hypothetical protein